METYFGGMEQAQGPIARERVLADLKALARDTEALLKATAQDASGKGRKIHARMTAALERAKVACSELTEQTVSTAQVAAQKADAVIREHPYQTIGVTFGLGLLIGVLVAPRKGNGQD